MVAGFFIFQKEVDPQNCQKFASTLAAFWKCLYAFTILRGKREIDLLIQGTLHKINCEYKFQGIKSQCTHHNELTMKHGL